MALANFFERTVQAVGPVLATPAAALAEQLACLRVGIVIDQAAADTPNGRTTVLMAANLMARLYPDISFRIVGASSLDAIRLIHEAEDLVRRINPDITVSEDGDAPWSVVVGNTGCGKGEALYVGSDGWVASVGDTPRGSGCRTNPMGAAAAGALGVAWLFRRAFSKYLPDLKSETEPLDLSLLNWSTSTPSNADLPPVCLQDLSMIGVGAVGNAAVWVLSHIPELSGRLNLVDPEMIDRSNLQRYVLAGQSAVGRYKTTVAAETLYRPGLEVHTHDVTLGQYAEGPLAGLTPDLFAVSVDNAQDRKAAQALLPRRIVNAWTGYGDAGVSRHDSFLVDACLMCLYVAHQRMPGLHEKVTEATGLPINEVRQLLVDKTPVDGAIRQRIEQARQLPKGTLASWEGRALLDLYQEAVCGGLMLRTGVNPHSHADVLVPLPHQSALAGIFQAAEIVKAALGVPMAGDCNYVHLDILHPVPSVLAFRQGKAAQGTCICQDADYIQAYTARHGHRAPTKV